jgi:hypothetical protein
MKIKIIKSSYPDYWYVDKIGKFFDVPKFIDSDKYYYIDNRSILKEDCIVINCHTCKKNKTCNIDMSIELKNNDHFCWEEEKKEMKTKKKVVLEGSKLEKEESEDKIMTTQLVEQQIRAELQKEFAIGAIDLIIRILKRHNLIKKSAKEEFEEYAYMAMNSIASVEKLINLARAAIEEEYQRGFAAGSVDKS